MTGSTPFATGPDRSPDRRGLLLPMARPRSDDRLELVRLVASLHYERGLSQQDIAEITGLSIATVSRLKREAHTLGIVEIRVAKADGPYDTLAERLTAGLGIETLVIPGYGSDPKSQARTFGLTAAPLVADRLPATGLIGWASGNTIAALVSGLPPMTRPGLACVQLVGGWDTNQPHLDASVLVRRVADHLGCRAFPLHAPAVFDSAATKRAVMADSTLRTVTDMWDRVDLAVITTGSPPDARTNYYTVMDRTTPEERASLLRAGVVGDALGHLFDITGRIVDNSWTERTITMPLPTLAAVPTVIAAVGGTHKNRSIIGLARTGVVDLLIVDSRAAEGVLALLAEGV